MLSQRKQVNIRRWSNTALPAVTIKKAQSTQLTLMLCTTANFRACLPFVREDEEAGNVFLKLLKQVMSLVDVPPPPDWLGPADNRRLPLETEIQMGAFQEVSLSRSFSCLMQTKKKQKSTVVFSAFPLRRGFNATNAGLIITG